MSIEDIHDFMDKHEWVRYGRHRLKQLPWQERIEAVRLIAIHGKDGIKVCKTCGKILVIQINFGPSIFNSMGAAMAAPLRVPLNYASVARKLIVTDNISIGSAATYDINTEITK